MHKYLFFKYKRVGRHVWPHSVCVCVEEGWGYANTFTHVHRELTLIAFEQIVNYTNAYAERESVLPKQRRTLFSFFKIPKTWNFV